MNEITITKEALEAGHGRYVARVEGIDAEAELVFSDRGPDRISADHTGAPDELRGTGAAAALVQAMVDDARENGFKILPLCPYVKAQYARHPDWADVFLVPPGA